MKLLFDECVTRRLRRSFIGYEVYTVEEAGMKGLKNGQLLRAAAGRFDVLITVDQNLPYQQNLHNLSIAILVLVTKRNTLAMLQPLLPRAFVALERIQPGEVIRVS
jgi:predicted nuclease of predicted toxin-antitoxin system